MLTEKEIYGCNASGTKAYWECEHCMNEKQKRCGIAFKSKIKAIGEHLLEFREDKIFVKIKSPHGYIGFESKYDLQKVCDILQSNKEKPYGYILDLFQ